MQMDKNSRWRSWVGLLAFVWLAGLVISYYVYHKPLTPALAASLGGGFVQLVLAGTLTILAGGVGTWVLQRWCTPAMQLNRLSYLALAAALGFGVLAPLELLVGASIGFVTWFGWGSLLVLLVVFHRPARVWLKGWKAFPALLQGLGGLEKYLAACLAASVLLPLLVALAPPLKFDALVYHLMLPRLYLQAGRFYYVPQSIYWGWPQTGEMLYTWAMQLAGVEAAVVLGWMMGFLAVTGLLGLAAHLLGARGAWVCAAAILSGFSLSSVLSTAYVDWLVILMAVAWLTVISEWDCNQVSEPNYSRRWLALAGVMAGMAFAVKYTAGLLMPCGLVIVAWRTRPALRKMVLAGLGYALPAALPALPWLLKNWWATGNPVYPLLFPAGAMTALRLEAYTGGSPFGGWMDLFLLPWRATFIGVESGPGYSASIGPLLFGLAGVALLIWGFIKAPLRNSMRAAALTAITGVLLWMILGRFSSYLLQSRLYYAVFPALALLAGAGYTGLQGLSIPGVRLGRLAGILIALVVGLNLMELTVLTARENPLAFLFAQQNESQYLAGNLGWYTPAMEAVEALPEQSHTLLLFEARPFYCGRDCEPDEITDRWLRERYLTLETPARPWQEILAGWRQSGYTHLLVHQAGLAFIRDEKRLPYKDEDWLALAELLENLPIVQDFNGVYTLYRLTP